MTQTFGRCQWAPDHQLCRPSSQDLLPCKQHALPNMSVLHTPLTPPPPPDCHSGSNFPLPLPHQPPHKTHIPPLPPGHQPCYRQGDCHSAQDEGGRDTHSHSSSTRGLPAVEQHNSKGERRDPAQVSDCRVPFFEGVSGFSGGFWGVYWWEGGCTCRSWCVACLLVSQAGVGFFGAGAAQHSRVG